MKKRIISVLIVSAMTAASAMSVTAFAESTNTSVSMDNPFSGCFEKQSNSEWKITDRGMKLINDDISEGGGVFNLHFMLKKHAEGSIIWNFSFTAEEKTYEADYIMMIPMYSAEEGTNLYLPVKDVIGLLNDTYPDEKIPYDKIEFGTVKDSAKIITDIEITAKSVFPSLTDHVWATYEKDENGKYTKPSNYFIFDDNKNGHTFDSEFVTGQGFTYEQDDNKLVFHFGSMTDEEVPAELKFNKSGDIIATITYPETTKTVKFELIPSAETESFGVVPVFAESVWTAYGEDENGDYTELWNYFVFNDEGSGRTVDPKTGTGEPFAYEQNGEEVMFHFGSIDDDTPAVFESKGLDIYATIDYSEFTKKVRFAHEYTEADPDTFGTDINTTSDFINTDTGWELQDAASKIPDANGTAGGNVGIAIKFDTPLDNGFDLTFKLVTDDDSQKNVAVVYSGSINDDTLFVKIRDLLAQAGVGADNVATLTVVNNGGNAINSIDLGTGDAAYTDIIFEATNAAVDSANDSNPNTGVGIEFAALGAVIAGTAAAISYRKRR